MNRLRWLSWFCATLAFAGGCRWQQPEGSKGASRDVVLRQIRDLQKQLAALKAENAMQASRIKELLIRNERLAKELKTLQFANAMQEKQIEALSAAPAERDRYKAQVLKLTRENVRLARKIAELEELLVAPNRRGPPGAATRPSSP